MREKENKINRPLFSSLFWEFVTDFTAFSPLNLFAGLFLPPQLKKLSPIFCSPLQRQDLLWKSHLSCKGCGFTALFKKPLISFAFISSWNSTVFSCNFLFTGWYHCNKMQLFGMGFFFCLNPVTFTRSWEEEGENNPICWENQSATKSFPRWSKLDFPLASCVLFCCC